MTAFSTSEIRKTLLSPELLEMDRDTLIALAERCEEFGEDGLAATALDRAYALAPEDNDTAARRWQLLDKLTIVEHGLRFRYIPAGAFLMGSDQGEPDERPVHVAVTDAFWMSDTPISWAAYCDLMGWLPPPEAVPKEDSNDRMFQLYQENKIRYQYCESETTSARDWHAHAPHLEMTRGGKPITVEEAFGSVPREDNSRPWSYDEKPIVAVPYQDAELMCDRLSSQSVRHALPSEAQWEKAARGGLAGKRYSWGDDLPTPQLCDFGHFGQYYIKPSRSLPPNGYGLFGMCGGVWEWTADTYDAFAYDPAASTSIKPKQPKRVLRGGSWADCADVVTVSFRISADSCSWSQPGEDGYPNWDRCDHVCPNIGFRIIRTA